MQKVLITILVAALIICGGVIFWQNTQIKMAQQKATSLENILPKKEAAEKEIVVVGDETADWLTYKNTNYGYEIKYPKEMQAGPVMEEGPTVVAYGNGEFGPGADTIGSPNDTVINDDFFIQIFDNPKAETAYVFAERELEGEISFSTTLTESRCDDWNNRFSDYDLDTCFFTIHYARRNDHYPEPGLKMKYVYFRFIANTATTQKYHIGKISFPLSDRSGDDNGSAAYEKMLSTFKFSGIEIKDNIVYYKDCKIDGANSETFKRINKMYFKDVNNVYWDNLESCNLEKLEGANPETFVAFGGRFGKDDKTAYMGSEKIEGADIATFGCADIPDCAKDKNRRYASPYLQKGNNGYTIDEYCNRK